MDAIDHYTAEMEKLCEAVSLDFCATPLTRSV